VKRLVIFGIIAVCGFFLHQMDHNGGIDFGAGLDADHKVVGARTTFAPGDGFTWRAHLSQKVGTTTVTRTIVRVGANGAETTLNSDTLPSSDPDVDYIYGNGSVSGLSGLGVRPPGTFTLRYWSGSTLLAQGTFTLTQ